MMIGTFEPGGRFAPERCFRHRAQLEWVSQKTVFGYDGLLVEHLYACVDCGGAGFTKTYTVPFDYGEEEGA